MPLIVVVPNACVIVLSAAGVAVGATDAAAAALGEGEDVEAEFPHAAVTSKDKSAIEKVTGLNMVFKKNSP
ncbi:hypothetical protein D3C85_1624560 [compost metagenome]